MDKFELGDIVLLSFPFTNADKVKKRPALVIKDFNDGDLLVCRILIINHCCPIKTGISIKSFSKPYFA